MLSLTYKFYFCEQEVDLTFKARSRAFAHEFLYLVGRGTLTAGILWYLHVETIYQEVPAKKKSNPSSLDQSKHGLPLCLGCLHGLF